MKKKDIIKQKQKHIDQLIEVSHSLISEKNIYKMMENNIIKQKQKHIDQLIEIGHSLTSEKNFDKLMELVLLGAKDLSSADGGTLYLVTDDERHLKFTVVQTDSLNIKMGGTAGEITWPELPLYKKKNKKNTEMVAALCALEDQLINIPDVYEAEGFNFDGTKNFDKGTGYRTKSMLVVPMKDHENKIIGVVQLLNKQNDEGKVVDFTEEDEKLISSMASQAAVSITNSRLIEELENLLNAFIQSIADAIGEKSKYTGGHINRVAEISTMIIEAINEDNTIYKDLSFTKEEMEAVTIAGWLHDIGKITTPEYVVDKATKLETIYDRVNTVVAKFEILLRDAKIEYLEGKITKDEYKTKIEKIKSDRDFVVLSNTGGEFMADDKIERIESIANDKVTINEEEIDLLTENEVYNLSIRKGTLTTEERDVINNHVTVTYNMLNTLPFPKKFKNVPVMAGSHHKKVGGGGYGASEIMDLEMTIEDKILAVADVFEALTAHDRPYKKANTLNQSLRILSFMVKDQELDRDLVKFFVDKGLHMEYASQNLQKDQLDEITVNFDDI